MSFAGRVGGIVLVVTGALAVGEAAAANLPSGFVYLRMMAGTASATIGGNGGTLSMYCRFSAGASISRSRPITRRGARYALSENPVTGTWRY